MKKYISQKLIGKGGFGKVYKIKDEYNKEYALKKINIKTPYYKENSNIITELQILRYHKCNYLIKYHSCHLEINKLCIITDFYEKGDLFYLIQDMKKRGDNFDENIIWKIFLDICLGVEYLHDNNIIHRDLKTSNILIDNNYRAYIGDFGVSKILNKYPHTSTQIGTPFYMSPELFRKINYGKKVDIWSLGCILYEMVDLNQPFMNNKSMYSLSLRVVKGNYPKICAHKYSMDIINLIYYLLETNPKKRLSIKGLLSLKYIQKKLNEYKYNSLKNNKDIPDIQKVPMNLNEWDIIINSKNDNKIQKTIVVKKNNFIKDKKTQIDFLRDYKKRVLNKIDYIEQKINKEIEKDKKYLDDFNLERKKANNSKLFNCEKERKYRKRSASVI